MNPNGLRPVVCVLLCLIAVGNLTMLAASRVASAQTGSMIQQTATSSTTAQGSLQSGGLLFGTVYGFNTCDQLIPLGWVTVTATGGGQHFATSTGTSGDFEMFLPVGAYNVSVSQPGYKPYSSTVVMSSGSSLTVNFYLEQSGVPSSTTCYTTSQQTTTSSTAVSSSLLLTPKSGPAGIIVNFPASGPFSPSDAGPCSITSNPSGLIGSVVACTILTNGYVNPGAFIVAGSLICPPLTSCPNPAPGTYTVTVTGRTGDSVSGTFTVTSLNLALNPSSGPVGTVVTVSGSGFGSIDVACLVTSAPSGLVTNSDPCIVSNGQPNSNNTSSGVLTPFKFTVGNVQPGSYLVQVKGTTELDVAQASFTVSGTTTASSSMTRSSQSVTMTVTVTTTVTSLTMSTTQSGLSAVTRTYLQVSSNSSISNLQFDSQRKLITFTVGGPAGTMGLTSVTFARSLINGAPIVLIDNGNTSPTSLTLTSNSTHYFLSITYPHSTHSITVGGSNTISEFNDNVTIVFLVVLATVSLVGFRRRHEYS